MCNCCWATASRRHRYLDTLQTRRLREFSLRCACTAYSTQNTIRTLTNPIMTSVTALRVLGVPFKGDWGTLTATKYLPNLKKLECSGLDALDTLLRKGKFTHSSWGELDTHYGRLNEVLREHPGRLTHLNIFSARILPYFIQSNVLTYVNLQHFGSLYFAANEVCLSPCSYKL